jgi:enoyl-CoA hydratase/carnithine racemase
MVDNILIESLDGGIRRVTFNRPHCLNAVNLALMDDLMKVIADLQKDDDARVVILRGAGRAFSTGDDLNIHSPSGMPSDVSFA